MEIKTSQSSRYRQPPAKNSQQVKKPSGKLVGANSKTPVRVNKQPPVKKSRLRGYLTTLGVLSSIIVAGSIIAGGIWLGILLMINPNSVVWINRFLPEWTRIPIVASSAPQTLASIQDEVRQSRLIPGEPQSLPNSELLLPILLSPPDCQSDCEQIVELRVYQPTAQSSDEKRYRLAAQLPIAGPEEYFVLSSQDKSTSDDGTLSRSLPLTKLTRFDDKAPTQGIWFNLSGRRVGGDTPMNYGQIVHYNPDQTHLSVMLQWTSPNEQSPDWQQVTSTSTPELIVNQTVGLEPNFKVYQLKPRDFAPDPIYLQEISLAQPAIDTQAYRNALILVRGGLWSPALQLLESQKKRSWSAVAQAQMDVIRMHAQVTQSQAKQAWATPSSSILANLIDGRFSDALVVFQSTQLGGMLQEIATLLQTDSGQLWERTEAALKVNPNDNKVKAWGALIVSAQQGRRKAIAWLKQLSPTQSDAKSENNFPIRELLDRLDIALGKASPTSSHSSQILGTARQVTTVNPSEWLQLEDSVAGTEPDFGASPAYPNPTPLPVSTPPAQGVAPSPTLPGKKSLPLQKEVQQVWYQVQVATFNDGQTWWQTPVSNLLLPSVVSAKQLEQFLGLNTDSHIQITLLTPEGSQASTTATIKAVSYRGGVIQLLAAGDPLPAATPAAVAPTQGHFLAYTDNAVSWLEPGSTTFADLNQQHPDWVSAIFPALRDELVKSGQLKEGVINNAMGILGSMGQWSVRLVELTGDNEPEIMLSLDDDLSGAKKKPDGKQFVKDNPLYKPHTLIFSNAGVLLYSEFSKDAGDSLSAIADLGDGGPAGLILDSKSNYSLRRWSSEHQRFE
jgi:hypothetical protein